MLVVLGLLAACSSSEKKNAASDSGTATGDKPAGDPATAAVNKGECFLGFTSGGVTYFGYSCSGTHTSSLVSGLTTWDDVAMTVSIDLNSPPALGKLDLEAMQVTIPGGPSGKDWEVPAGACTLTATKSFLDKDMDWTYFRIDASCSAPANPADGNPGKPLDLGNFSMVTFFTNPTP
jgi:hypothetical protein